MSTLYPPIRSASLNQDVINILAYLQNQIAQDPGYDSRGLPGTLMVWPTATPPPFSLQADNSAVSRTMYASIFGIVGTMFGVGDGSTTFNLPGPPATLATGFIWIIWF